MVLSTKNELDRALAVKETWGQKCDDLLFIADYDDPSLPAVDMKAEREGTAACLVDKIVKAWQYVHDKRMAGEMDFDFVLKADLDTMPIMENIRKLVVTKYIRFNTKHPLYIGKRQKYYVSSL